MTGKPITVVSPAKEIVRIMPDAEFIALTNAVSVRQFNTKRYALGALWLGGTIKHKTGKASKIWHARACELGYKARSLALTSMANGPGMDAVIKREIRGKQTYAISLIALPESWYAKLIAEYPSPNGAKPKHPSGGIDDQAHAAQAVADLILPKPDQASQDIADVLDGADDAVVDAALAAIQPTIDAMAHAPESTTESNGELVAQAPVVELEIANSVAQALLTQVVEIISAGSPAMIDAQVKRLESELELVGARLADRLTENERYRVKERDWADQLRAAHLERDGLRERLRQTEANLRQAIGTDTAKVVDDLVKAEIAKIMRAKPIAR